MPFSVDIDGTDITSLCQSIRWRPKLNRVSTGIVRYPAHLFQCQSGLSEMHIYNGGTLVLSGPAWYTQAEGSPNSTYAEVTGYDHTIYLGKRLCKTALGNLITPGSVILSEVTGPAILRAYIQNAINDSDAAASDPLPLTPGSTATGGVDLSGVPTNFPMTIEQMRALLVSTGKLNVLVSPGVGSSTVNLTNGGVVNDLSGSVSFEYQTGAYNCQIATVTEDMEDTINALWYFLGPRLDEQHWRGSITADGPHHHPHPTSPNQNHQHAWPAALIARINGSRTSYGYMQEIRVFDDKDDENSIRPLFEEEWANEAHIRATPRQFVSIRPQRGTTPTFGVGDRIHVAAGSRLHGGFSGDQIVYEYEVLIDADGVVEVTDILTSADQEG